LPTYSILPKKPYVGDAEGDSEGRAVGWTEGDAEGWPIGAADGIWVGTGTPAVGCAVGVGSLGSTMQ
jgi:hypothetical protein